MAKKSTAPKGSPAKREPAPGAEDLNDGVTNSNPEAVAAGTAIQAADLDNPPGETGSLFERLGAEAKGFAELTFARLKSRVMELASHAPELIPDEEQTLWLREAAWKATAATMLAARAQTGDDLAEIHQLRADAESLVCDVGACKAHDASILLRRALQETWSDVMDVGFGILKKVLVVAIAA
jgi:hypothetical protein